MGHSETKLSRLVRDGVLELEYKSDLAFYTLKRVNFGKTTNMITAPMTPNHMGVRSVIEPNSVVIGNSYSSHPICDIIQDIPPTQEFFA